MKRQLSVGFGLTIILTGLMSAAASAHVSVKPTSAGLGAYQTFTMVVPTEKEIPTVALRLVIPNGLTSVSPNVKPGWTIEEKKTGEGENAVVSEISWTAGSIPDGQRDEFVFSAKTPPKPTTLHWKAYQTYEDGTVVAWDQAPVSSKDMKDDANALEPTPYSETKIVDDLSASPSPAAGTTKTAKSSTDNMGTYLSVAALALSVWAIAVANRNRANPPARKK